MHLVQLVVKSQRQVRSSSFIISAFVSSSKFAFPFAFPIAIHVNLLLRRLVLVLHFLLLRHIWITHGKRPDWSWLRLVAVASGVLVGPWFPSGSWEARPPPPPILRRMWRTRRTQRLEGSLQWWSESPRKGRARLSRSVCKRRTYRGWASW